MDHTFRAWLDGHDASAENPLIPASTVIVLRDAQNGLETLMLRRNSKLSFAEGMWAFPGGRIDPEDYPAAESDEAAAARTAAVREANEEADITLDPDTLVHYSHWLPPVQAPKRFSTWFFIAPALDQDVTVDQGEITDHRWLSPTEALEQHQKKQVEMLPPTWMTLNDLTGFANVRAALKWCDEQPVLKYATRMFMTDAGMAASWDGDVSYQSGDPTAAGPRHRLLMAKDGWVLERDI